MNDTQILTIALSTAPTMLIVLAGTNVRIGELRSHMDTRFEEVKDLWRSELHRVEEVLDARLKHIEER